MIDLLIHALAVSKNEAADDVLLEAMSIGDEREMHIALDGLLRRATVRGLGGLIERFDSLPEPIQAGILSKIGVFHHALRECGRSDRPEPRMGAMKLIALGRQGKLAYVLSENLHEANPELSKAATEAMVALARWVATETRGLQRGARQEAPEAVGAAPQKPDPDASTPPRTTYRHLMEQRPEIEAAVARALDVHRGRHGQELLRAALLLADWVGSKTLGILHTTKHGGQGPMIRRLQQAPASEHVEAFLLAAAHAQLRTHFGTIFAHIDEAPVLDALLRKTHWLKDHQLELCMHQAVRGAWFAPAELSRELERRTPEDGARIGEWIATSGLHEGLKTDRLEDLLRHAKGSFDARLRIARIALRQKQDAPPRLLQMLLSDGDERIVRMAARELVRRKPPDFENQLLQRMTSAPDSVRRVISRAIGQAGFEQYWNRFDRLEPATRRQAGRAMMKLLPDAALRLQRRLMAGPVEQRVKAMQIAQELELVDQLRETLIQLCNDPNPKLRSKAIMAVGRISTVPIETLIERLLQDSDARVRANAIEVLEAKPQKQLLTVLAQRARAANSRERANAIKALNTMKVGGLSNQLLQMLRDVRPDHRVSAMWTLRQVGWWQLLAEVGRLAKSDADPRVRRYALTVLRSVAELAREQKSKAG